MNENSNVIKGHNRIMSLTVNLASEDQKSREIVYMYEANIESDLDQIAWNLCDTDKQTQAKKFGSPSLESYKVSEAVDGNLSILAVFRVAGDEPDFLEKVADEYMDVFDDYLRVVRNEYYSRFGTRAGADIRVLNWDVQIK